MMEFFASGQFDIFHLYQQYCDIKSGSSDSCIGGNMLNDESEKAKISREGLAHLSKVVDLSVNMRVSILNELQRLMSYLNVKGDFSEFSKFYDFVFFVCRENRQKNITVSRAIAAWKLVLAGRFRLLNQWCDFVEKNQRYNISEDTWRQVLAFSRCVHEDLQGYDPEGAWPTLIDDFVEHMYRITGSNDCSSRLACNCGRPEGEQFTSEDHLPGLRNMPGLKRKMHEGSRRNGLDHSPLSADVATSIINFKRRKQQHHKLVVPGEYPPGNASGEDGFHTLNINNSSLSTSKSPCAIEGSLSQGFAGLLSSHTCVQNQDRRASYT